MYWHMTLVLGAALVGSIHAQQPQITAAPRNIVVKRQTANIEIHQEYAAPIGVDTEYLKIEGSTTKVCYLEILKSLSSSVPVVSLQQTTNSQVNSGLVFTQIT